MKEHLPALALVAAMLLAAWLYLRPPGPPPPTASAPVAYVRQLSPDEPLSWMDDYWEEQRKERMRRWAEMQAFSSSPYLNWPILWSEGNTSDL